MRTREQLEEQARLVESLRASAKVARLRYDNGYTSYIDVLDAERSLFDAELGYTQTKGALFQALIDLYKAMGGGWITMMEPPQVSKTPAGLPLNYRGLYGLSGRSKRIL